MLTKFAFRNILRNRRRSLLTILSMGFGFFLLGLMLAISEGSYSNMIKLFTSDKTGHVQIHADNYLARPAFNKTINNTNELFATLEQRTDVVAFAPRIFAPSLAYGNVKSFPAQVVGIDPIREAQTTHLKQKITQGQWLKSEPNSEGYFEAILGYSIARNLNLNIGDELVLISQGIDGSIANDIFIVSAIVGDKTSNERLNIYLSLNAMNSFIFTYNQAHEIAIRLNNYSDAELVANELNAALPVPLNAAPWQEVENAFYRGMQTDKKSSYYSVGIIIFIVAIGVLNSILMSTLERTREFGVLRAIGTAPKDIFQLIMLESGLLALISCVLGTLFALPCVLYFKTIGISLPEPINMGGISFQTLYAELNLFSATTPFIVVLASTLIVSLYPALRAAKISPLKAMQAI